jgi:hypothetical protein
MPYATARQPRKALPRWAKGRPRTNNHIGPIKMGFLSEIDEVKCLQMLADPGQGWAGTEIQKSDCEHCWDGR